METIVFKLLAWPDKTERLLVEGFNNMMKYSPRNILDRGPDGDP